MQTARLDYLTIKLSSSFTFGDWWNFSQSPIVDEKTGEVCGVRIPQKDWRVAKSGKTSTISCWANYAEVLAQLALTESLDITRIDLCIDIEGSSDEQVSHNLTALNHRVQAYYLGKRRSISNSHFTGTSSDGRENETYLFGGRKSPYQLRLYSKSTNGGGPSRYRIEFQLKGKLAKTAWQITKERYLSPKRITETFASLEAKILEPGIFGIDWQGATIHDIDRSEYRPPSQRELWIRTQVLSACIKEFYETGKNLPQILLEDFNNHFIAVAAINIDHSNQYAALELKATSAAQTTENED